MTLRVLMVEDSPTDAKLVLQALRQTGRKVEHERVENADAMREALAKGSWDIILSDWSMPKFTASAALAIAKATNLDLPFIIVSGTIGEETAVEAMRAGAHDYVLKDKLARLAPAVERELRERTIRVAKRQAEAALRESEFRFRRLAESGAIGILIGDLRGTIIDANETYAAMLGYTLPELLELRWPDLTSPEFKSLADEATRLLQTTGVAPAWEMELLRKGGGRVSILAGAAMLEHPKCLAFTVDLTARKQLEAEKSQLSLEAKQHHAGRQRAEEALKRSEDQLRQAQKMEAVGRLAGGVAHDFNNVLSIILSYGEIILADLRPQDPLRSDVEEIRKAAARAAGLTRQLLLFSRQQVLEPRVLDVNDTLASMAKMVKRMLGEDVELVMSTPDDIGRVRADPSHIEQVILNLVVNARDAMPTGGKLTIETANVELDDEHAGSHVRATVGSYVMLAVSDTGCGMDEATQARIFEPFFTTKAVGKGTGLGLSTVFGIVQQSGGAIWVCSEPGKGSVFKVYLPRVTAELDSVRTQVAPVMMRGSETVMVVEDEEQVRAVVVSVLRRQGYQVISAQHPGEAIIASEKHPGRIDLLLTDVVMPQMSGPELAKRLGQARPEMKVLCMSGYTDDSIVRHGVIESHMAFLQKPITPASLSTKIREVLDHVPRAASEKPPP